MLVRVFYKERGSHHSESDFRGGTLPANEIQIYSWPDTTLREVTSLIVGTNEIRKAERKTARFSYSHVFQNKRGRWQTKYLGSINAMGTGDSKTLKEFEFKAGDFLDVVVS